MFEVYKYSVRLFIASLVSIFALSSFGFANSAPPQASIDAVRKEIEGVYAKRDKAFKTKDFEFLKSQETSDYTEKSKDGTVRGKEESDAMADQMAPMVKEVTEQVTKVENVTAGDADGELVVESSDHGRLTLAGPDGQAHEAVGSSHQRDTWVKTKDGWKIKYHEELDSHVEIDGKPVN
ncbi:MAG TPA: nuclear transport factor 2 family protein [Blastocatellia bacterium]|nr:nuclear transport factor 2 family protein [Blastocatellia bacterium]